MVGLKKERETQVEAERKFFSYARVVEPVPRYVAASPDAPHEALCALELGTQRQSVPSYARFVRRASSSLLTRPRISSRFSHTAATARPLVAPRSPMCGERPTRRSLLGAVRPRSTRFSSARCSSASASTRTFASAPTGAGRICG